MNRKMRTEMPSYSFYNTKTEEYFTEWYDSYKDVEKYVEANPHINWLCGAQPTADPIRLGRTKTDDNFKDLLKTIKKGNPKSTIDI